MRVRLIILVAVVASFGRLGFHEFTTWDDPGTIHQNPNLHPPTLRSVGRYWIAFGERAPYGLYIPLTYTLWGGLAKVALLDQPDDMGIRLNPYVFHLANVGLHALAGLVLFALLRRIVERDMAALIGALVWVLHPVQVEPVGWASGTKDVLSGLLAFVALWHFAQFRQTKHQLWRHYAVATLAFVAAMLAKPSAIVVPMLALILDVWVFRASFHRTFRALAPWFVLTIPCMLWTRLAQTTPEVAHVPLYLRPLIALDAVAFYLKQLIWPIRLGIDYGRMPAKVLEPGWHWAAWVVPLLLAVMLVLLRRRACLLVAATLIFVAGLLPVLGLVPFQFQVYSTVADHYLYIALLGPAIAAAWVVQRRPRPMMIAGAAVVVAALGFLSSRQAGTWRDDIALFERAIAVNPRSFLAHNNLGATLLFHGDHSRAEAHLRRAIELHPMYGTATANLADVLVATGRPAQAVQVHLQLADRFMAHRRPDDAAAHYEMALKIDPQHPQAADGLLRARSAAGK